MPEEPGLPYAVVMYKIIMREVAKNSPKEGECWVCNQPAHWEKKSGRWRHNNWDKTHEPDVRIVCEHIGDPGIALGSPKGHI